MGGGYYNDAASEEQGGASIEVYRELLEACPIFAETCLKLWGNSAPGGASSSKNVWFFDRELFRRTGGRGRGMARGRVRAEGEGEGAYPSVRVVALMPLDDLQMLHLLRVGVG